MTKHTFTLGHHLVAFLDVQGQGDTFDDLRLPETPEQCIQVEQSLKNTAGFVVELRELFRKQFEVFEAGASRVRAHTKEPVRPKFVGFSDSFIISVALRNDGDGDLVRAVIIFSALSAAAVVMITALASRHALRGGIDVGLATEIGPQEIYGTALKRAYLLECRTANYPRIAIGTELLEFLKMELLRFGQQTTPVAKAVTAIVQKSQKMITLDKDGNHILDYLGPVTIENSVPSHASTMIQPAYDFVLAEQTRLISNGDQKLINRYALLREYFESRLPLWGLSASET